MHRGPAASGLAMVLVMTSSARAEPNERADRQGYLSVPVEIGGTSRDGGRITGGLRPELLFTAHGDHGIALGPYAELARSSADTALGGGATLTYYLRANVNLAPSIGVYHRWLEGAGETGYAASVFVGYRWPLEQGGMDFPLGLRLDYRADLHERREVSACVQLDLMSYVLMLVMR